MLDFIISFINGLVLMLCINHFKPKLNILFGGVVGLISYILFENFILSYPQSTIFSRIFLWIFFAFVICKRNFPRVKYDYIIFRILILIVIKMIFEKILLSNISFDTILYHKYYAIIYSWLPLILVSIFLDVEMQSKVFNKIKPNFLKFLITFLCTLHLIYAYYFILRNF